MTWRPTDEMTADTTGRRESLQREGLEDSARKPTRSAGQKVHSGPLTMSAYSPSPRGLPDEVLPADPKRWLFFNEVRLSHSRHE